MCRIKFEVGESYQNRKGAYEVLEITGDEMRIRWDEGEEVTTTITLQSRITNHMQQEEKGLSPLKVALPGQKRTTSKGWQRSKK